MTANVLPASQFRADIECLRAISVSLVVIYHAFPDLISAGYLGVDVFFVISGYLITRNISIKLNLGQFSFREFYTGRIRRLMPAFVACLATVILLSVVLFLPEDFEALAKAMRAAALGYANHDALRTIDYFGPDASGAPLLHTWSLSVEEQFYIALPVLLWALSFGRWSVRFSLYALICAASLGAALLAETVHPDRTFYLMPYRAWEFLAGGLVALAPPLCGRHRTRSVLWWAGLTMLSAAVFLSAPTSPLMGRLLAVGGAALLIVALPDTGSTRMAVMGARPIQALGRASYSIYLWHWPVMVFAAYVAVTPLPPSIRVGAVILSVVLGFASWGLIETPARQMRWSSRSYMVAAGCVVALVGVTVVISKGAGLPGRLPAEVVSMAALSDDRDHATFKCRNPKPPVDQSDLCGVGETQGPVEWVVWGDSHAWALQESLSIWLAAQNQRGVLLSYFGCPPVVDVERVGYHRDCRASGEVAIRHIERERPKNVVLVSIWTDYLQADLRGLSDESSKAVLPEAIARTVRRLNASGVKVWVIDPMPQARSNVPSALARGEFFGTSPDIEFSQTEYRSRNAAILEAFSKLGGEVYGRISPQNELCRTGYCQVVHDNRPLYFDNNHLAFSQAEFMAGVIDKSAKIRGGKRPGAGRQIRSD
jgi:peptidoglycan/LPS O-acetylase OafA/YrhL